MVSRAVIAPSFTPQHSHVSPMPDNDKILILKHLVSRFFLFFSSLFCGELKSGAKLLKVFKYGAAVLRIFAEIVAPLGKSAGIAFGFACEADIASVQD